LYLKSGFSSDIDVRLVDHGEYGKRPTLDCLRVLDLYRTFLEDRTKEIFLKFGATYLWTGVDNTSALTALDALRALEHARQQIAHDETQLRAGIG